MRNRILILAAIILAGFYLVARPHVGTTYEQYLVSSKDIAHAGKPIDRFTTREQCEQNAKDFGVAEGAAGSAGTPAGDLFVKVCKPATKLMWGW